MSRCQRLQAAGLCLALGVLLSACDPKPTTPSVPPVSSTGSGSSPSGVTPAASNVGVDPSTAHKGPSEGGAAIGGMSGPGSSSSSGSSSQPTGGDGAPPR